MYTESPTLPPDAVFDVLSNSRRRAILYILRTRSEAASVTDLAERIAAIENDVPVSELAKRERKRVYVSLYQTHVPKLESTGLVERTDGDVRVTDRARAIDRYLVQRDDRPGWYRLTTVWSVGGLVGVGVLLSLGSFGQIAATVALAVFVVCLGMLSVAQFFSERRRALEAPAELRVR